MLAEIFMLRLEAASRNLNDGSFGGWDPRFEPFVPPTGVVNRSDVRSEAAAAPIARMSDRQAG
jgi:hypothetical protein